MENQTLQVLVRRLNLIEDSEAEPESYILSKEEEDMAIEHEIYRAKEYKIFRLTELGDDQKRIVDKIASIDWDQEINREEILKRVNSNKHQDLWHKEQRLKEKAKALQDYKDLTDKCTAKYMFKLMKWTSRNELGKELIVNDYNIKLITTLCYFLSNDGRFETELGFSFKKGLIIRGISGLGKTHIVKCLEKNELNPIHILSMIEITDEIKNEGEYEIKIGNNKVIYLDDVGTEEPVVNHYGTKISFFKQFIETVYLRNRVFNKLMISTNNNFKSIEEKYGFRVRSRMKDMFNTIDVEGEDMRGKNE